MQKLFKRRESCRVIRDIVGFAVLAVVERSFCLQHGEVSQSCLIRD